MVNRVSVRTSCIALWMMLSAGAYAIAEAPKRVDIPAGELSAGLLKLSKQYGADLVYRPEQVHGLKTRGAHGQLTTEQAATELLRGTPLELRTDVSGAMLIAPPLSPGAQAANSAAPASSPVAPDANDSSKEGKKSSSSEFPLAQMAPGANPQSSALASDGANSRDNARNPVQLEEIVVTAQKRSENILFVPASVTFVSSANLEAQHATQLQDYAAYVPGLQVDSAGSPGQTTLTLRGIAPLGSGASVGTYIDDAPIGSSSQYSFSNTFQLDLLPYDLRGIEVLRGPQGTLYGASTMGGLIKYVLQSPDSRNFSAAAGGELMGVKNGRDVGGGLRGMINLPVIEGVLALRASGFYENTPGYIDDPVTRQRGINAVRQEGGRLAVGWTPISAVQDNLEVLLQRTTADGDAVMALEPTGAAPVLGDLTTNTVLSQPFLQTTEFIKNSAVWSLHSVTVTSVSSYSDTRNRQVEDASAPFGTFFPEVTGAVGYAPQKLDIRLHKFTGGVTSGLGVRRSV